MGDENTMMHVGNRGLPKGTADRPLVTFALFAYNQEQYIREAVEGAFSQTYEPLEIILSDDSSTDTTFAIMQEMARTYIGPHLVKVNRTYRNLGLSEHLNSVAAGARGDLIVVAAGDDVSDPNRTTTLTNAWLGSDRRMIALQSGYRSIDRNSRVIGVHKPYLLPGNSNKLLFAKNNYFIVGAAAAYDSRVFSEFPPMLRNVVHEDRVLPFRAMLLGGVIGSVDDVLMSHRNDVGISAVYRGSGKIDPLVFSKRALSDNLQKMIDARHVNSIDVQVMLCRNLARYSSEVLCCTDTQRLSAFVNAIRYAGLFLGIRAFLKSLIISRRKP